MGITHGNLLWTYKWECRRVFSQTLHVTLVMQGGLPRANMYSHAGEILALQCVLRGSKTIRMHTRAHTHTHKHTHTHTHTHKPFLFLSSLSLYLSTHKSPHVFSQ